MNMSKAITNFSLIFLISIQFSLAQNRFMPPVSRVELGPINYAKQINGFHSGIDYLGDFGDEVKATASGRVIWMENMSSSDHGMGNNIIVAHSLSNGSTKYSFYGHLDSFENLQNGDLIIGNSIIGQMGHSGYNCANYWNCYNKVKDRNICRQCPNGYGFDWAHLHFEIKSEHFNDRPTGNACGQCGPNNSGCWGYTDSHPDNFCYQNPDEIVERFKYAVEEPIQAFVDLSSIDLSTGSQKVIDIDFKTNFYNIGSWNGYIYLQIHRNNGSFVKSLAFEPVTWDGNSSPQQRFIGYHSSYQPGDYLKLTFSNGHNVQTDINKRYDIETTQLIINDYNNCVNQDKEPNGSFNTSASLNLKPLGNTIYSGSLKRGTLHSKHDIDIWNFRVNIEGTAVIKIKSTNEILEYDILKERNFVFAGVAQPGQESEFEIGCLAKGEYHIKIKTDTEIYNCEPYEILLGWIPEKTVCNRDFSSSIAGKDKNTKSNNCQNCIDIDVRNLNVFSAFGSGHTYNIETHLIGFDENQYYNVYAADENGLVGTRIANVQAVSSTSFPPNILLENIPCGSDIVFRVEHVNNPDECFYEESVNIANCGSNNKNLVCTWPGPSSQCFIYNSSKTITWSSTNVDKVNIQLCPLGEECYYLEQGYTNTGSYSWTTPAYDGDFYVKITDFNNDLICDEGSIFEIDNSCNNNDCDAPDMTNLSPTSGKSFNPSESFYLTYEVANMNFSCQLREYEIWFSGGNSFPSNNTVKFTSESSRLGPFTGLNTIRYYWKVRAVNRDGEEGPWSPTYNFLISSSSPLYNFEDADLCASSNHSNGICSNDVSSFALNTKIYAACEVTEIRERLRIKVVWKDNSNNELYTNWSNWTSSGNLNFSTDYTPAIAGSYEADFYVDLNGNELFQMSKSFTVNPGSSSSGNGNLKLLDVYSDSEVNNNLTIEQGGYFIIRAEGEFTGNLGPLPNRELVTKVGFFIKRIRSSNVSSSWYKFIGDESIDFECPSFTSICNGTYTDRGSNQLQIPYDVEPGNYYILGLVDYLNEWNESNESDQSEYMSITVTPKCDDIFPIYDSNPTTRSIKLSWDENANVSSTDIRYRKSGETVWTVVNNFTNGDILNGLEPCTLYEQQVLAHCPGDDSNWSRTNGMKTKCEFPCLPPDERSERPNYESAGVYWGDLERVYLYEVRWRKSGTSSWLYDDNKGCCYDGIPNLIPGTLYEWQIRTECPDNEFSNWSSSRTFTTKSSCSDGVQTGLETGVDCGGNCPPCDCEQEYHVLDYTPIDNTTIEVMKEIEVSSPLGFGNSTILKAGEAVTLSELTEVKMGSELEININNCEND